MSRRPRHSGFTLIELILVMGVLATLAAIVAPRLTSFSKGRECQSEWNRFRSVLRYARNEAISRSTPVEITVDPETGAYRIVGGYWFEPRPGYEADHPLPRGLAFEFTGEVQQQGAGISIVFQPDGTADMASPREIRMRDQSGSFDEALALDPVLGYKPQPRGTES